MPIYDFKCAKCEEIWSILVSVSDYSQAEIFECDHCGAENTRDARVNIGAGLATTIIGTRKPRSSDMW